LGLIASAQDCFRLGVEAVGGKAMGLAELGRHGAPVPEWFVVRGDALLQQVAGVTVDLGQLSDDLSDEALEAAVAPLIDRVLHGALSEPLLAALRDALANLGTGPFAVRSSMVGEDSAGASFAGQLESFLFRRDATEVIDALRRCWASALAPRVLRYRLRHEARLHLAPVGVVIQRQLAGQVSGVLFTAHPITGRRDHVLITAAWGQGEGVVSGLCNTDEYVLDADGTAVTETLADKDCQLLPHRNGEAGLIEVPVDAAQRSVRCLSQASAAELAGTSVALAAALGGPLDIEWTIADDTLYFLQARPITALPAPEHEDGPQVVFDNSNIQESYCGVTTPLTFSFASRAYASVYRQTMRAVGLSEALIQAHEGTLRNLLGLVRGRIYYNLNNWYRGLLLLPSFGRNKADMEAMMGVTDPVDFIADEVLSFGEKLRRFPQMVRVLLKMLWAFRRLRVDVPNFLAEFARAEAHFDRSGFADATFSQLIDHLAAIDRRMLDRWHVPIINDFRVMMTNGALRRIVARAGFAAEADGLVVRLMAGEEGIESTEPTRELMRLAAIVRNDPALREAVEKRMAMVRLAEHHPAFHARVATFIERYGDRVMGELKLETLTLRTDPTFLFDVVRSYLDRPDLDADRLNAQEKAQRAEAEATFFSKLSFGRRRGARRALAAAREAVKNRENMRLARTRMFGLYRSVYDALGVRLEEAGQLLDARSIFYLTVEELEAYHEGRSVNADLGAIASARRGEFEAYQQIDLPHRFTTRGPVYHGNRYRGAEPVYDRSDPSQLSGIGCYPGVVEAPLCVVRSPQEASGLDGQILVALRTDPGWAPLFPSCSGLLVERGSTLSHSAVVARELGIPAIVNIPDLLNRVIDGERVRMDGAAGHVQRLAVDDDA
jgi:rifampicin phosphotransferase